MTTIRRLSLALAAVAAVAFLLPAGASGHAILEESEPRRGAALERAPEQVTFRFNEPVEAGFGSVRVYDREGERVDEGELIRPEGRQESVGVAVEPALGDGIYTATYRVISADSHPVSGGFTFTVGDPGGAAEVGVAELIDAESPGAGLEAALGAARFTAYLATGALLGGVIFLFWVWLPVLSGPSGTRRSWATANAAFARRLRRLFAAALATAALATAAGVVIQGAIGTGGGIADGLRPAVIDAVLGTDFGVAWGLRLVAVGLLGVLLLRRALPTSGAGIVLLGLAAGYLALAPGLGGHPGATDPRLVSLSLSFIHVLSFAVWAGGLGVLAVALPAATREVTGGEKTALLAATVSRFSGLALAAVIALLASGVVQSILQLESFADLWETGYGRALLVKAGLLAALIGIGAYNRQRLRPELNRLAQGEAPPGRPGHLLRRTLRSEVALIGGVLAATAVLTALSPAAPQEGPFAGTATLGSAQLEVTVDPATVGRNEVHAYLFDSRTGEQFRDVRELRVDASLPSEEIGPLDLRVRPSGPGHYVIRDADLAVTGVWELAFDARVSAFEQHSAIVEVPIR
ncbi:MAG TPA: CopD family protein [Solirubrobacterales bacterium]|nr:CopD family protein [Solirubrobacterales bacterium]